MEIITLEEIKVHLRLDDITAEDTYLTKLGNRAEGAALKKINPKSKAKENKRRDGSFDYYLSEPVRDNDAKGVGPFIWASLEMERMK